MWPSFCNKKDKYCQPHHLAPVTCTIIPYNGEEKRLEAVTAYRMQLLSCGETQQNYNFALQVAKNG